MEKKQFSLIGAIRSIVDGTQMDEANAATIAAGKAQMRAAGLNSTGAITSRKAVPTAISLNIPLTTENWNCPPKTSKAKGVAMAFRFFSAL